MDTASAIQLFIEFNPTCQINAAIFLLYKEIQNTAISL